MFSNTHLITEDPLQTYYFKEAFTAKEIAKIDRYALGIDAQVAQVGEIGNVNEVTRKSTVRWLPRNEFTEWIYERIYGMVNEANEKIWHFTINSMPELIQYTEYFEDGGHYDFHLDMGKGFPLCCRKISIAIQLSDPSEYEGGDFQIVRGNTPENMIKGKGTALLFPSYLLHRVTPVTKGTRRSLVLWVGGGSFK